MQSFIVIRKDKENITFLKNGEVIFLPYSNASFLLSHLILNVSKYRINLLKIALFLRYLEGRTQLNTFLSEIAYRFCKCYSRIASIVKETKK